MWTIEVSSQASEEEIDQALLEELDFDYIRECVAKLKLLVEKYGPFNEVDDNDELESIDARRVWTAVADQWNGYSWIHSGYSQESSGATLVTSWYVAEKPVEQEEVVSFNIEFIIGVNYTDDEDDEGYFALDLWSLIDTDEVSDQAIMGALAN